MLRVGAFKIPEDLYFSRWHTWVNVDTCDSVRIGLDDYAQRLLGKIIFVDFPFVGDQLKQSQPFGNLESEMATETKRMKLYGPVSGTVRKVNEVLVTAPELVNQDPYGSGWLVAIAPTNLDEEMGNLLRGQKAVEWITEELKKRKEILTHIGA